MNGPVASPEPAPLKDMITSSSKDLQRRRRIPKEQKAEPPVMNGETCFSYATIPGDGPRGGKMAHVADIETRTPGTLARQGAPPVLLSRSHDLGPANGASDEKK